MKIENYIKNLKTKHNTEEICKMLHISQPMLSRYSKGDFLPSLRVAKHAFKNHQVVLYPFSKEAVSEDYNV